MYSQEGNLQKLVEQTNKHLNEMAMPVSSDDYYKMLSRKVDPSVFSMVRDTESPFYSQGADIKTEMSDSGNIILRYAIIVKPHGKLIALMGLIADKNKILSSDVADVKGWMSNFCEEIRRGTTIIMSANTEAESLVKQMEKVGKELGIRIKKDEQEFNLPGEPKPWKNIILTNGTSRINPAMFAGFIA